MKNLCLICKKSCTLNCSVCKQAYYCGKDHQNQDWSNHKIFCNKKIHLYSHPSPKVSDILLVRPKSENEKLPYNLTTEEDMKYQIELNRYSLSLALPLIEKCQSKLDIIHSQKRRCFISIELIQASKIRSTSNIPIQFAEFPFFTSTNSPIIYDSDEAEKFAEKVQSSKLLIYTQTYETDIQIPCAIWCEDPCACYTVLIIQPGKAPK